MAIINKILQEINTPLLGKTGSLLRKASSKTRRAVKKFTEPQAWYKGNRPNPYYTETPLFKKPLTRDQAAATLITMRGGGMSKDQMKQTIRKYYLDNRIRDVKKYPGWFERNNP